MDFNKYDGPALSEKGARLHLLDYVTGEPITQDGKDAIVLVKGAEASSVRAAIKAMDTMAMASEARDAKSADDAHDVLVKMVSPMIAGFENISNNGKDLTGSDADVAWFLGLQKVGIMVKGNAPTFGEQVLNFARSRESFLGNA